MRKGFVVIILGFLFVMSCTKENQSCSDGIFDPKYEEKTDCGGVCPPCDYTSSEMIPFLTTQINNKKVDFQNFGISKNENFSLYFSNDSVNVVLNFGAGDTLGGRPIEAIGSNSMFKSIHYSTLIEGYCLLSEVEMENKYLSGYFSAKFLSDNGFDTLSISHGEFHKAEW